MNNLICMTFDGDYVTEGEFDSVAAAWERCGDLGSRWYFYPFNFVTTASGKTIVDAPELLNGFIGKRVRTVAAIFAQNAEIPELRDADAEQFALSLA